MNVGFTGTRKGMNDDQKKQLNFLASSLLRTHMDEFHHGGAVGADTEAHDIAHSFGWRVCLHPALGSPPFIKEVESIREAFPPLDRNRHIVSACHVLIAAPETDKEEVRSGTWATVRYARAQRKPVIMLSRGDLPKKR